MTRTWGGPALLPVLVLLVGCAGRFQYAPPAGFEPANGALTVAQNKADLWAQAIPALQTDSFVLDALEKDSGLIVMSYVGDPEPYVDCGHITSYVRNLRGERTYRFPAAAALTQYELMTGKEIVVVGRHMNLEARINVRVADAERGQTQISVYVRYALTRTLTVRDTQGGSEITSHTIFFHSGQEASFPGSVTCRPVGALEKAVLSSLTR